MPAHELLRRPGTHHGDGVDADRNADVIARRVTASDQDQTLERELTRPGTDGPLPPKARHALQSALGYDFSAVRVHHDPASQASAALMGARAYNIGPHIMMGSDPDLAEPASYARTMVHEAVHVAQRGLAPPLRASVLAQPLIQPIGGLPVILRQPGPQSALDAKWFPPMKKLIEDHGLPAIVDLAKRLNFASSAPQRFHTAKLGNDTHQWELTLRFVRGPRSETRPLPDQTTGPAASTGRPQGQSQPPGMTVTHRFDVSVQVDFGGSDPRDITVPASASTDPRQKGLYLAASALYHELTHVVLLTDTFLQSQGAAAAAQGIATGGLSSAYGVVTQAAASSAFTTVKTDLIGALVTVGQAANRDLNLGRSTAEIAAWAAKRYDLFVQEKFVFATTAMQFATAPRDSTIALSYVLSAIEALIPDPGMAPILIRRLQANSLINGAINQAADAALKVFALIDQILTPVSPGPGAIRTPPLGIGGQPIQE